MTTPQTVTWAAGELYEPYVGRWSRRVAPKFLEWLGVPAGRDWLDVGCGTGALVQAILDHGEPASVRGVDPSEGFIGYAAAHITDPRVTFATGDARSLPVEDASIDGLVSGLVLNFVPTPETAVAEMVRVVRPGGDIAVYVWDYAGKMELMRYFWDAAVTLDSAATAFDEANRFAICKPEALSQLFESAGLAEVSTTAIDIPTVFRDFDDYWTPFLAGQAPAPAYAMSLDEVRRAALREHLRVTLPSESDGSISLVARAWAVRGKKQNHRAP